MNTQNVSVSMIGDVVNITGSVNGIDYTWIYKGNRQWEAVVDKSYNSRYAINLTAWYANGTSIPYTTVVWYGFYVIVDRTQADTDYAFAHQHEDDLKGAYNDSDLNRVGHCVNVLAAMMNEYGYSNSFVLRENWQLTELPNVDDWYNYLDMVRQMRKVIPLYPTTPQCPLTIMELMQENGWDRANDIERILWDIWELLHKMIAEFIYSGEINTGESDYN